MEMVADYLFRRFIEKKDPLPFPEYLSPRNRYKNDFWITQEGECIYPWQMDNRHLVNTVNKINKSNPPRRAAYEECNADQYILFGLSTLPKKSKKLSQKNHSRMYTNMWEQKRLYMLLRREIKLRGLEKHI
jgi:hypothetical protein